MSIILNLRQMKASEEYTRRAANKVRDSKSTSEMKTSCLYHASPNPAITRRQFGELIENVLAYAYHIWQS